MESVLKRETDGHTAVLTLDKNDARESLAAFREKRKPSYTGT